MSLPTKDPEKDAEFGSARLGPEMSKQEGDLHYMNDYSGRRASYDAAGRRVSISDAVFGEITEGGPNYRDVRLHPSLATAKSD